MLHTTKSRYQQGTAASGGNNSRNIIRSDMGICSVTAVYSKEELRLEDAPTDMIARVVRAGV